MNNDLKIKHKMKFRFYLLRALLSVSFAFFLSNLTAKPVIINEIMSKNKTIIADVDGEFSDWIELYNTKKKPVNLKGYGLSNNADDYFKWVFPEVTIPANGFLIIFASGKDYSKDELHTNFTIKSSGKDLFLTNPEGILIDSLEAVGLIEDQSYGRKKDAGKVWLHFSAPTPASSNVDGVLFAGQGDVKLNEIQSHNTTGIQTQSGERYDWIELYNSGKETVKLNGYTLTDDKSQPQKWAFPDVAIDAGGFFTVFASKKNITTGDELHCNFDIKSGGEAIFLYDATGALVDYVLPQQLTMNQSYGRIMDGNEDWKEFYYSTPGKSNQNGNLKHRIDFSHKPGQYAEAFELDIFFEEGQIEDGLRIHYTTDGSEPISSSQLFQKPIKIDSREGQPNYYSSSKFQIKKDTFEPHDEVFKINVIRARVFKNDKPASKVYTKSYMIHPDFDRYTLPMISIVSDPENLFSSSKGIYVTGDNYDKKDERTMNCFQRGKAWERDAHFEFFMEDDTITQNGGIRIHGGGSRREAMKSFRLYARSEYDKKNTFDYPFFPEKPIEKYKRLILRAQISSNVSYMTDEVVSNICKNINVHRMATRPVVLFLNGEYWGMYNLRERIDKYYLASNFGVDKDSVTILKDTPYAIGCNEEGTADEYVALMKYLAANDINDPAVYNYISEQVDLEQFATYLIAQFWSANYDWPIHNVRYWKAPGRKWQWILFDIDFGMRYPDRPCVLNYVQNLTYATDTLSTELGNHLFKNKQFQIMFADVFEYHLKNTFSPERVACEIFKYRDLMMPGMEENLSRIGSEFNIPYWGDRLKEMYGNFVGLRPCHIRDQIYEQFGIKIDIDDCEVFTPDEDPCDFDNSEGNNSPAER